MPIHVHVWYQSGFGFSWLPQKDSDGAVQASGLDGCVITWECYICGALIRQRYKFDVPRPRGVELFVDPAPTISEPNEQE